ncbi:MAG TPA: xanthine dehydrogenase family protein molybdopterin-binding subunit [Acetobacteraceae bacterium]|nr:xanthine dehydrogenase family protein molybdopterin-binding subunit [Acetobacteraceae bacterium]
MPPFQPKSLHRREDARLLTGRGRFTGDAHPPGLLHVVLVRSPHAHADVTSIDTAAARDLRGVIAVVTAADLANVAPIPGGIGFPRPDGSPAPKTDRAILAQDRVRFVGEPVAAVIAETRAAAQEAAEAVLVEYAERPAVVTSADAMHDGAPQLWEIAPGNVAFLWRGGQPEPTDTALRNAAHVTKLDFMISRVTASAMEPRNALAAIGSDGRVTVTASHQNPHSLRGGVAQSLHEDPSRLRVTINDVGGSFGMKSGLHQEVVLVAWAARLFSRPVLWESDRTEAFLTDEQAREIDAHAELGFDANHRITAFKLRWNVNLGAYVSGRSGWSVGNIGGTAGVYLIPHMAAEVCGVLTNTVPTAAYRGAGRPEATYTIERIMDVAARELGLDPFELRRINLIPPEAMPYKTALTFTYDCGEFEAGMRTAADLAEIAGFPARRDNSHRAGKLRGLGICNCIEVAGGPFLRPGRDNASIALQQDGRVILRSGTMSVGQGLETSFAQLVADRLGIALDQIEYRQGDTDDLPFGRGSGGSGAMPIGASAISIAADQVIEKARRIAAEILEAAVADVTFESGRFRITGTDRVVDLAEIARAAHDPARLPPGETPGIDELGAFQATAVTFPNGTHICEVEVDPDTGVTEIVRYTAVEDLGRILNPMLVAGQIHGGVVQGLGQALGEQIVHDATSGQMLTASFMDYQMPRAIDVPEFRIATREVPTQVNPVGAKGVGEAGTVGAMAAVVNAVNDALAQIGIRHFDMPATPNRVWMAIQGQPARNRQKV